MRRVNILILQKYNQANKRTMQFIMCSIALNASYKSKTIQAVAKVCNVQSIALNENTVITTAERLSIRAHHTGELLLSIIWWTRQPRTNGFHMKEESLIGISTIKSRNRLRIFVNTFISGTVMTSK